MSMFARGNISNINLFFPVLLPFRFSLQKQFPTPFTPFYGPSGPDKSNLKITLNKKQTSTTLCMYYVYYNSFLYRWCELPSGDTIHPAESLITLGLENVFKPCWQTDPSEKWVNGTGDDGGKFVIPSFPLLCRPLAFIALLSSSTYSSPQLWLSLSLYKWERVCMQSSGSTRTNSPCRLHLSGGLRILKHFNNRLRLRLQLLQLGHDRSPLLSQR